MKYIAVVTTVASLAEAGKMAADLVEPKLPACAQISEIESFYRWQGVSQNEKEFRILFKTREANYTAIEDAIREMHSYELPAIHAFALEHVFAAYGKWIEDNSQNLQQAPGSERKK